MVLNFETEIEILLFDQNKIVTYKELNNHFDITPFKARKELNKFIENANKTNKNKSKFYSTYLIIGLNKHNEQKKIFLANEDQLESIEQEFNILSKQIYSIQCNQLNEFDLIYASDLNASNNVNRKSNIKITTKLGEVAKTNQLNNMESMETDDLMMMNMVLPSVVKSKSNQENKPVVKKEEVVEKKEAIKIEPIINPIQNETKKRKSTEGSIITSAPAKAAATATKAKKTNEPAKNQKTMTSFFKKA